MKKPLLAALFLPVLLAVPAKAQTVLQQYFDGADTSAWNSIIINIDTAASNVWQVGPPQKTIFNSAATVPNVLVTDTVNNYPVNNTSSFSFSYAPQASWGILGLQWYQKLDMDSIRDGGIVEYSLDGVTWTNAINDPYVYNFYGFDPVNVDTLLSGEMAFTGRDSTWRDIWLCFDMSFIMLQDTFLFRYTLKSDSIETNQEGWMIDNMMAHVTIVHTANTEGAQAEYMKVFPSVTDGVVNIQCRKIDEFHIIEHMELYSSDGKLVEQWKNVPTKFFIDISAQPPGTYFLKITTNKATESFPVILER